MSRFNLAIHPFQVNPKSSVDLLEMVWLFVIPSVRGAVSLLHTKPLLWASVRKSGLPYGWVPTTHYQNYVHKDGKAIMYMFNFVDGHRQYGDSISNVAY